jgi:O-antigen/teichoic acid export membrane protein
MEMKYPVLFQTLDSILQLLIVGFLILRHANFITILIGYVIANVPGFILTVHYSMKYIAIKFFYSFKEIQWLWAESLPLFLYLVLAMLYERLDVIFLKTFWGESQVGIYSSAFRLTAPLIFVPYVITSAIYPVLSKQNKAKDILLFGLGIKILLLIGVLISTAGLLIGKSVFILLFGEPFLLAVVPFQLLLWSQSIMFLSFFIVDFNNSQNRQHLNTYYIAIMFILSLILQRIFIMNWGVQGAGWVKIFLNSSGLILLFLFSFKYLQKEQINYFIQVVSILFLFLLMVCLWFVFDFSFWIKLIVLVTLILICFIFLFNKEEKIILKKTLRFSFEKYYL